MMNTAARSLCVTLLVLGLALSALAQDGNGDGDDVQNCYAVHGEARYGAVAYKHIVVVTNRCDLTLHCEVWTDVDPSPKHSLTVGPNGSGEVIVRANSPSREFTGYGECKK
jgi:hypothetical protein